MTAPNRILIVGTTGSGKTTLSRRLAAELALPHIELDSLHWEPGWVEAPDPVFQSRLADALTAAPDGWVVDGNYFARTEPVTWVAADTAVFLDFPLPLILVRLLRRTVRRSLTKEELWGSNRERLRSLVSRDSLLWWAIKTHHRNRQRYRRRLDDADWQHVRFVRLRNDAQVEQYVASLVLRA
jgi:adenylate kinase family enzyme